MKTVKFYTLGCKVNQYETQVMREQFIRRDYTELNHQDKADIYVINTCTVTATADRKSRDLIRRAIKENPCAKVIITGCYTQLDNGEISKIPGITQLIKNEDKNRIVGWLNEENDISDNKGITSFQGHTRAFLKIQDGCNNTCSYCKIPLVRGKSRSRNLSEILEEAGTLIQNDFKEIVFSGICLGAYGKDLHPRLELTDVIEELEGLDGTFRIRLSSIEAQDINNRLIEKFANSQKLCRHLHIPMQSGDDEILRLMQRRYTSADYEKLVDVLRKTVPEIAITTDIMVGFPGEKEENFENTIKFLKYIQPSRVHIFPYSPRKGTFGYDLKDKVDDRTIKAREEILKNLAQDSSFNYRKNFINKTLSVLVEAKLDKKTGLLKGYSDNYIEILFPGGRELTNQILPVKIERLEGRCTFGVNCLTSQIG